MKTVKNLTIELSGLRFFGHYGLYPVESKWTTELTVDVSLQMNLMAKDSIQLQDTIDYIDIYRAIETEMNHENHQLLESIALHLIRKLKNMDERIQHCKVKISKQAQLGGPSNGVAIEMEY